MGYYESRAKEILDDERKCNPSQTSRIEMAKAYAILELADAIRESKR
jgi:hypothetical protein